MTIRRLALFSLTLGCLGCTLTLPSAAQIDDEAIPPEVILSPNQTPVPAATAAPAPAVGTPGQAPGQLQTMPTQPIMGKTSRLNWTPPGQAPTPPTGSGPPAGSSALLGGASPGSVLPGSPTAAAGQSAGQGSGSTFGPTGDDDCPTCPKKPGYKPHIYGDQPPPTPPAFNAGPLQATTPGQSQKDPLVVIETTKGTIVIRLFRQHAPKTVSNFIDLAGRGFYNGLLFHRVEPGFVVQTGCPNGNGTGGFTDPNTGQERRLGLELNPRLRHNAPGVVAMARTGNDPHSASSQFYITLSPQDRLDNKYAVFGGVIKGMDIVQRINTQDRMITVSVQEQD